jgi:hypothetical protein
MVICGQWKWSGKCGVEVDTKDPGLGRWNSNPLLYIHLEQWQDAVDFTPSRAIDATDKCALAM